MVWDKRLPLMILLIFNLKDIIMKTYMYSKGIAAAGHIEGMSMFTAVSEIDLIVWADLHNMKTTKVEDYGSAFEKAIKYAGACITVGQNWSEGGIQCYYAVDI